MFQFDVPRWILIDNGKKFKEANFTMCCADFGIEHQISLAPHPQMNDQFECANRLILQVMKIWMFHDLEAKGRNWHNELPSVLWALCAYVNHATRDTLFHMVYGADEVRELDTNLL
jgi:transposase InsO family protein